MKISIRVFECLDEIARSHSISDYEWAEAANIRRPTIPELRRVSRAIKSSRVKDDFKRACTLEKISKLYEGLKGKLGNAVVVEALKKFIESESDQYLRLQLMMLIVDKSNKETRDRAESLLKGILTKLGEME